MKKYIAGYEFINMLIEKGIIERQHGVRRVTIDALADAEVVVYVEFVGDELLLEIGDMLDDAKPVVR